MAKKSAISTSANQQNTQAPTMMKYTTLPAILATAVISSTNAFVTPTLFSQRSSSTTTFLYAGSDDTDDTASTQHHLTNPFDTSFTRPLYTAVTSAFLATSLLFSNPLLPTPEVQAATAQQVSPIATSVDIEIKNLPALTRKAIANRDALTNYIIDSAKSIKPILELLSESDTVTVIPPKDVKGAVNALLTKGDAQFNVNGQSVDVRVESVPGVIVVRVINPNIPRLPFLKDGTAALKFVDEIVDVAPAELEKVAEEAEAIEKFLTWGAPQKAPITYKGSTLDYFLSSKFLYNGKAVSLGGLGDLTNSEVIFAGLGVGIAGAYGSSYAYYTSEKEKEEKEAAEKKAAVAAKKKAKAKAASAATAKTQTEKKDENEKPKPKKVEKPKEEPAEDKTQQAVAVQTEEKNETVATKGKEESSTTSGSDDDKPKGRKRDAIKNLFRRNKE